MSETTSPDLREQIADALRTAAVNLNYAPEGLADAVVAVVQPEIDRQVRAVQGWMALDLHMALGIQVDSRGDVEHQGHRSWADWWAELCGKVRTLPGQQRAKEAHAAIARVRELHSRCEGHTRDCDDCLGHNNVCSWCGDPYPCPTIAALDQPADSKEG